MTTRIRPATWEECQSKRPDMIKSGHIAWPPTNEFWIITEGAISHRGYTASLGEIIFVHDSDSLRMHQINGIGAPVLVHDGVVEPFSGQSFIGGLICLLWGTK